MKKVAVVGAGTMGADIAYSLAMANIPVVLRDVDENALQRAQEHIRNVIESRIAKGRLSPKDAEIRFAQIRFSSQDKDLYDVSVAIEAVPEKMALKQQVFRELDRILPPLAILASNTSALSISEMANATTRPERVAGMHFFYPAHTMKLVEIIAGENTDQDVLDTLTRLSEELRKIPVVVKECPGFVVNRILTASMAEVMRFKAEHHVSAHDIDAVITKNHLAPMGPFVLADALGLDIAWDVAQTLQKAYGDRFYPGPELGELVQQHHLGVKTGQGFYSYTTPEAAASATSSLTPEQEQDLIDQFTMATFMEAARVFEEGIASARAIDIAMRAGAGLPMGPLALADSMGLDVVYNKLTQMSKRIGERFTPPASLKERVERGQLGVKTSRGYFNY
ncbi:3-hydroxyacyl-CoA dehydrogenase [Sulfobacillus thermosulfidooxidans]|uniref:3-hydroxyacyl-CoA dehydrogenase n=1 Tax=Sulfobacillus thermosulfidooxidans TaxID=28034 RepID=UPI001FA6D5FB|nr:3-hydroxyacyl-CoA dehydrogenase [Sulfobacillus thermosulfidooxidans]